MPLNIGLINYVKVLLITALGFVQICLLSATVAYLLAT